LWPGNQLASVVVVVRLRADRERSKRRKDLGDLLSERGCGQWRLQSGLARPHAAEVATSVKVTSPWSSRQESLGSHFALASISSPFLATLLCGLLLLNALLFPPLLGALA